ncbi:protein PML-like isoform X2 [Polyodon spathula]|nr:protein PML-like isoform X2 [Polyodon spathula]
MRYKVQNQKCSRVGRVQACPVIGQKTAPLCSLTWRPLDWVSDMMENKENIGDSLNSKASDKGTPLLECAGCLPSPAPAADQHIPVEDHSIVFFDLETTGLGSNCDIIQLSAVCMEKTFDVYMVPRTPIAKGASAVTGFTVRRHKLYLHRRPVQTKTHRDCLMSFLAFLQALNRPLLAGHNIKRFDCPILARALEEFQLNEEFKLLVSGFLDTLILSKDLLQNTGIKSFKQESLVKELLKKSYPAHNALEDVKALQDLCRVLRPTPTQITSHLFTLDQMESLSSLQPLVEEKAISKTTAQKLARLGYSFEKMKHSHLQNPSEGLRQFLEPLKAELKNSMFTKTVDKICEFFKIEH